MTEAQREIANIEAHIKALLTPEYLASIGANVQAPTHQRELHHRCMRIFADLADRLAALSSAPPDLRPVTEASPAVGVDGYDGEHVLAWWPIMTLDDDGNLTDTISEGRWLVTYRYGNGSWFEPAEMEADWCDDEQQYGESPLFWLPLPADPVPSSEGGGKQYPGVAASARDHQAGAANPVRVSSAPPDLERLTLRAAIDYACSVYGGWDAHHERYLDSLLESMHEAVGDAGDGPDDHLAALLRQATEAVTGLRRTRDDARKAIIELSKATKRPPAPETPAPVEDAIRAAALTTPGPAAEPATRLDA